MVFVQLLGEACVGVGRACWKICLVCALRSRWIALGKMVRRCQFSQMFVGRRGFCGHFATMDAPKFYWCFEEGTNQHVAVKVWPTPRSVGVGEAYEINLEPGPIVRRITNLVPQVGQIASTPTRPTFTLVEVSEFPDGTGEKLKVMRRVQ